ncbi:MAG: hypothetical protein KDA96_20895, partial [Planctomycetaceae bacterium]|nr:hypothetical protein [Planctomycetaceae bacterium]
SDGTTDGTVRVRDIQAGGSSAPSQLTNVGGSLYFTADDGVHGREIWKSDGTESGTTLVIDLNGTAAGSNPGNLTDLFGALFFTGDDGVSGNELWRSDGTAASTIQIADIRSGSGSSNPSMLTDAWGTLYFTADDGTTGVELWSTNGETVSLVEDSVAGSGSSSPLFLTKRPGGLLFQGTDGSSGRELGVVNDEFPLDYGDAPLFIDHAYHLAVGPRLGSLRDAESGPAPNAHATGDDGSGVDDEDGVVFIGEFEIGGTGMVDVDVQLFSGYLSAWIDFGQDQLLSPYNPPFATDQIILNQFVSPGTHRFYFQIPANAKPGTTYARFRISTSPVSDGATGGYGSGEIEDYEITLHIPRPGVSMPTATSQPRPWITWGNFDYRDLDYEVWVANQSTRTNPVIHTIVDRPFYQPESDLGIGIYNVWVRTRRAEGYSAWSYQVNFRIRTEAVMNDPGRYLNTARPQLTWQPLAGAVKYDLWIDDAAQGISQVVRDREATGTSWTPSFDLPLSRYTAWVRGIAADGTPGNWSTTTTFYAMPAPEVTQGTENTFDRTPTIAWNALPGAVEYQVFIRNLTTGTTAIQQQHITDLTFTPTTPLTDGKYRLWVQGISTDNVRSSWSPAADFYVGGRPDILTPSGTIGSTTPAITWTSVAGADHYELWVDQVGGASQVIHQLNLTGTSFTPATPLTAATYRIWVRAISTDGETSIWSNMQTFAIS